jgi:hypothetical protein
MGEVVAFPLARRTSFISRHAKLITGMRPDAGERHLERQLAFQFETLLRKNIDVQAIDREVASLRSATQLSAKLCGLLVDRKESGQPGDFAELQSADEVLALIRRELGDATATALAAALAQQDGEPAAARLDDTRTEIF